MLWELRPHQLLSSANTCVNHLPGVLRRVRWKAGTLNADLGGGRFDRTTDWLAQRGVQNVVYDPFNRSPEHNARAVSLISGGRCDSVTSSNVLNVIAEPEALAHLILLARDCLRPGGVAYFLVHEGDRTGVGRTTRCGWQENRRARSYVVELTPVFRQVRVRGNLITCWC